MEAQRSPADLLAEIIDRLLDVKTLVDELSEQQGVTILSRVLKSAIAEGRAVVPVPAFNPQREDPPA